MQADTPESRQVLEPSELIEPVDVLAFLDTHNCMHGLYGWWFDESLPQVLRDGCCELEGKHLLYVGIAPPKSKPGRPGSATPFRRRLWRNHIHGSVRSSTLRLSLAALLKDDLKLEFFRDTGKRLKMAKEHEAKLTAWIEDHAGLSMVNHDAPRELEAALVRNGPPLPLNLSMSTHPFKDTLSSIRSSLCRR